MKRRLMALLCTLFALIGVMAIATACGLKTPKSGDEAGEYYCDYEGAEYSLTLGGKREFTLKIASETMAGGYVLDGESLTLNVTDGDAIAATYKDDAVALTYQDVTYSFLRKIEYLVKFDTDGGSAVADIRVVNGRTAAQPQTPTKENKVFVGWYTDKTYKNVYYFSQPVRGNVTVYARFVDKVDPEFTVSFDANYPEAGQIASVSTAGNMLYDAMLPTPTRTGYTFVGWYVSQFRSAEKLSYAYNGQKISEPITLYAVWDEGDPVVTVTDDGVEMSASGVNLTYELSITAPDGTVTTDSKALANDATTTFAYAFADKAAGEYKVEVTVDGKTTTRYYNNKSLARVSAFKVEGTTLMFNAVEGATEYTITVVCGVAGHAHTDVSLGTETSYDFSTCDMRPEGIDFVVSAKANNMISSTSDVFTYTNKLNAVANLSVDPATQIATWDAVDKATAYRVTVTVDGGTPVVTNVGNVTSYALKSFAKGSVEIAVVPVAYGWNSPEATKTTYAKATNATPTGITVENNVLTWEPIDGVSEYEVQIGEKVVKVTECRYELSASEVGTSASVTVTALGDTSAANSLPSDAITVNGGTKVANVVYNAGYATWDAVIGATAYEVKVNNGTATRVSGTSAKIVLTKADTNTIAVRAIKGSEEGEWAQTDVTAYEVELHLGGDQSTVEKQYLAEGDPIAFAEPVWAGYDFVSWYNAPNGPKGEGVEYRDPYFGGGKLTLHAYFEPHKYTITLVAGDMGESVTTFEVYFRQSNVVFPVATSKSYDYTFRGWYTEENGGENTQFTDEKGLMKLAYYTDPSDKTLYAHYIELYNYTAVAGGWSVSKGAGMSYVTEATIPATHLNRNVVTVEDFSSLRSLEVLNIPSTVTTISLGSKATAFTNCTALKAVNVYDVDGVRAPTYASENGMVYEVDHMRLIFVPFAIGETVNIPDGITEIVAGAFYNNLVVKEVYVPATVTTVQAEAFRSKSTSTTTDEPSALERITFANSGAAGAKLTIADKAFYAQRNLVSLTLPKQISNFSSSALYYCSALSEINVLDSMASDTYYSLDGVLFMNTTVGKVDMRELAAYPAGNTNTEYTIPSGIESIGGRAFYEAKNLTSLTIPGEIRNIATDAFRSCSGLLTLTFGGDENSPDLTIGDTAFYGCNKITELTLPANLVEVGANAFGSTNKLTKVVVNVGRADDSEVKFGTHAFGTTATSPTYYITDLTLGKYCPEVDIAGVFGNKAKITVDPDNKRISAITEGEGSGALYNAEKTRILYYMGTDKEFTLPNTVEEIPDNLFRNVDTLEVVNIPASVKSIGDVAFDDCDKLKTVNFKPDTETGKERSLTIGQNAFQDCTALTSINLPEYTTKIGKTAFAKTALTSLNLPRDLIDINQGDANANNLAIYNIPNLKTLTVSAGNTKFKAENSVLYELALRPTTDNTYDPIKLAYVPQHADVGNNGKLSIPETVTGTYLAAARYNASIKEIEFADQVYAYDEGGNKVKATMSLNNSTFYNCTELQTVKLPEGLVEITTWVFYGCPKLVEVTIPSTVTTITQAFPHCTALRTVRFADKVVAYKDGEEIDGTLTLTDASAKPTSTSYGAFGECPSLEELTLPEGTVLIGSNSFVGCTNLRTLNLPSTVTTIGKYAFYNATSLETVTFPNDIKAGNKLTILDYAFYNSPKLNSFEFAEGITEIGYDSFYKTGLQTVQFPASLEKLGDYAFQYAKIKTADFSKATKLGTIGKYVFAYSTLAGDVTIPASVESIGEYTFNKTDITSFTLAEDSKLTAIPGSLFYYTANLTSVNFGAKSKITTIGGNVFYASGIPSITIPASVTTLSASALRGATKLATINFETGSKLASIGNTAFQGTVITEFTFPTVVEEPEEEATATATADTTPATKYKNITLGTELFKGCTKLKTVTLSPSIAAISNSFKGCASITKINVDADNANFSVKEGSDEPILYNKDQTAIRLIYGKLPNNVVTIPEGVKSIDAGAYYGQFDITKVILPYSLTEIGANAFQDCIRLEEVAFLAPDDEKAVCALATIGNYAFDGCVSLSKFPFETANNLQSVGTYGFQDTALETLDLSKNVVLKTLGNYSFAYIDALTEIKALPDSLTTTGTYLFYYCVNLQKADLANSKLSAIADRTFCYCAKLSEVTFPKGTLTTIGKYAFGYCDGLINVDLSECSKLTKIGAEATSTSSAGSNYVFGYCDNLEEVKFPSSLTFIGDHSFYQCYALTTVDLSNTKIKALHTKAAAPTSLTTGRGNETYIFADCSSLEEVKLPSGCNYIGNNTFQNCVKLSKIDLSKIKMFGQYAFDNSGLTELTLPTKMTGTSASNAIGPYCFRGCLKLETVTIPNEVKYIGTYTFRYCTALETVTFGDACQVTVIGAGVFDGCTALTNVVNMPSKVTELGTYAFQNCTGITEFDLSSLTKIGGSAFLGSGIKKVNLPSTLNKIAAQSIGASAFENCTELTEVFVGAGVKAFFGDLFKGCTKLKTVTFEEGSEFQSLYSSVFEGCTSLTDIIFQGEMSEFKGYYSSTYHSAFKGCTALETVDFTNVTCEAFTSLNKTTFEGCTNLTTVKLPAGLLDLGESTFKDCVKLTTVQFPTIDGVTIGTHCFENTGFTTLEIPYNVTKIGVGAFAKCSKLTELKPQANTEGATRFTAQANGTLLYDETGALAAALPNVQWDAKYETFTSIGEGAFDGVHGIENLTLPATVTEIGDYAFRGSDVKTLTVPASVTTIGSYAFAESEIQSITFLGSATALDASTYLFEGCTKLTSVTLPDGLTTIGNYMFQGCTNLTQLNIPSTVTTIGTYAFNGAGITAANLENVTAIGQHAFEGTKIVNLTISETLVDLGSFAFSGIDTLQTVTIKGARINVPSSSTGTSPYAAASVFENCKNLETVDIQEGTPVIGTNWFFGDVKLKNVTLPETSLTEIKNYAFAMGKESDKLGSVGALKEITIPASITTLGTGVFIGSSIEKFVYPEGISGTSATGTSTFEGVTTLKYVYVASTIDSFNAYTFRYCTGLEYVVLAEGGSTQISNAVFYGCTNLRYVELPASSLSLITNSFVNCEKLRLFLRPSVMSLPAGAFYSTSDESTAENAPELYFEQSEFEILASYGIEFRSILGDHVHYNSSNEQVIEDLKTFDNWEIPMIEWIKED